MSLRILLADDESLNALALRAQLEVLGHTVVGSARDGLEAVELASTRSIDLAILDIKMPGLSGIDAAQQIAEHQPVPIILLSGHSNLGALDALTSAPVFHLLTKPVSLEDLIPAIAIARSRFEEWQRDRAEPPSPMPIMEGGVAIERATAMVMEARGITEDGAQMLLQRESLTRNEPIDEIARNILIAGNLLRDSPST